MKKCLPPEKGAKVEEYRYHFARFSTAGRKKICATSDSDNFNLTFSRGGTFSAETGIPPILLRSTDLKVEDSGEVHLNRVKEECKYWPM